MSGSGEGVGPLSPAPAGLGVLLTKGPVDSSRWSEAGRGFGDLDDLGCSTIWLADHLFWGEPMPEALIMTAVAASTTSRCGVGTGVLQLPLRSAASVAKAAATLQLVSGGRFVLGVGSGEHAAEYERAGVEFSARGRTLDRAIDQVRAFWSEGEEAGRFAQRPAPGQVPVWIGGSSPAALARAAVRGDGWLPLFVTPERFERSNRELDRLLGAAGRPTGDVVRSPVVITSVTSAGWSRDRARSWAARLWSMDGRLVERYLVTGSAHECAIQLSRYRSVGAGPVAVLLATDRPIEMFAELNPAFQAESE